MRLYLLCVILLCGFTLKAQVKFNGNLEQMDKNGKPLGWELSLYNDTSYQVKLDSIVKRQGKYSISITPGSGKITFGAINHPIHQTFHGELVTLIGTIKTEDVKGYAGVWLSIDGVDHEVLQFDNMQKRGITGTTDWKEYYIQLPYNEEEAVEIRGGALLVGKGKIWVDSLRLYLDDKPIDKAPIIAAPDTLLKSSGLDTIIINKQNTAYLALVGQLWGFLKYHHPVIAKGDYDWDAELLKQLPLLLKCRADSQVSNVLEYWVDQLGKPALCTTCKPLMVDKNLVLKPDYGSLFNNSVFSKALTSKLQYILANSNNTSNYYVDLKSALFPNFNHEKTYRKMKYPDAGYRLLALYRYWNMVQYFFPSRHLIEEGWSNTLSRFIPEFIHAQNKTYYAQVVWKLIASIHDTHANAGHNNVLDEYKGYYQLPFKARFVEGKLVVSGYYKDTLGVKGKFKPGDIITSINGSTVTELVKKYLPITPASNYDTQLRDLPGSFLLRSKKPQFTFGLNRNNKLIRLSFTGIEISDWSYDPKLLGHSLINKQIGYVFPGRYKNADSVDMKKMFASTKGIIIDMRCYPSDDMIVFDKYIKPFTSPFVRFSAGSINHPGSFTYTPLVSSGEKSNDNYKGKVVVIVNADTQSNAEFVTMAFQSDHRVTVIGSTTAGADGNVSEIVFPGGISTSISGIGVFYPDGTNAQRKGVKIDYLIKPTIQGVKAGHDELLEKAKQLIMEN